MLCSEAFGDGKIKLTKKEVIRVSKKLTILWILLFLVSFLPGSLFAQQATTMFYEQIVTSPSQGTMVSKVWIKGEKMRMEHSTQEQKVITLVGEKVMYFYYPLQQMALKMNIATETSKKEQESPKNIMEYLKSINAKPLGQEQVADKLCNVYQVTWPETGSEGKIWIWIEKKFPVKSVMTVKGETVTAEYRNIQMDIPIPKSYFLLPQGIRIVDMSSILAE